MNSFTYKQDQKIAFDNGVIKGYGKIVGIATNPQAIIGAGYIVEPEQSVQTATYPYTHIVCFENQLSIVPTDKKSDVWEAEKRRDNPHHYTNRLD